MGIFSQAQHDGSAIFFPASSHAVRSARNGLAPVSWCEAKSKLSGRSIPKGSVWIAGGFSPRVRNHAVTGRPEGTALLERRAQS